MINSTSIVNGGDMGNMKTLFLKLSKYIYGNRNTLFFKVAFRLRETYKTYFKSLLGAQHVEIIVTVYFDRKCLNSLFVT